jgi:hypothetical protein
MAIIQTQPSRRLAALMKWKKPTGFPKLGSAIREGRLGYETAG